MFCLSFCREFSKISISIIVTARGSSSKATNNFTNAQTILELLSDFQHVSNLDTELKVLYNGIVKN